MSLDVSADVLTKILMFAEKEAIGGIMKAVIGANWMVDSVIHLEKFCDEDTNDSIHVTIDYADIQYANEIFEFLNDVHDEDTETWFEGVFISIDNLLVRLPDSQVRP